MNQFIKPVIALVCTGNTCRSPMAETLLREQLRSRLGREDAVRVLSAGVAAISGSGASPQAIEVMGNRGLDLTGHSSRPLDDAVMNVADLVLTMTRGHREAILAAWPDMHERVFTLRRDGGDITDPVGMPVEVYQQCADQMDVELAAWLDSLDDDFFPDSASNQS
ncbi:MAG: low molecular weight protein arginine phosphatase [Pirellulales bacterium]|nr:low molecular weight protein arginine phosphatase [Pirellulales bacterium]